MAAKEVVRPVADQPIRAEELSVDELRALYELILERMEISGGAERRRWARKVHRWSQSVRRGRLHVPVRELVER